MRCTSACHVYCSLETPRSAECPKIRRIFCVLNIKLRNKLAFREASTFLIIKYRSEKPQERGRRLEGGGDLTSHDSRIASRTTWDYSSLVNPLTNENVIHDFAFYKL